MAQWTPSGAECSLHAVGWVFMKFAETLWDLLGLRPAKRRPARRPAASRPSRSPTPAPRGTAPRRLRKSRLRQATQCENPRGACAPRSTPSRPMWPSGTPARTTSVTLRARVWYASLAAAGWARTAAEVLDEAGRRSFAPLTRLLLAVDPAVRGDAVPSEAARRDCVDTNALRPQMPREIERQAPHACAQPATAAAAPT